MIRQVCGQGYAKCMGAWLHKFKHGHADAQS